MCKSYSVSVCVPVYNVSKFIKQCAESLFNQTMAEDIQFIFVDDCTPDDSIAKLTEVISHYPLLKNNIEIIHHNTNKGLAGARNTAFSKVKGKYFINADSDDWYEPDYISSLFSKAELCGADITGCDCFFERTDRSFIKKCPLPESSTDCLNGILRGQIQGWLWIKLFRTDFFKSNKISWVEGLNIWEDMLICTKAFFFASKISYIEKPLYHYNKMSDSLVSSFSENKIRQIENVIKEMESFLKIKNIFDNYSFTYLKLNTKIWLLFATCGKDRKYVSYLYKKEDIQKKVFSSFSLRDRTIIRLSCFSWPLTNLLITLLKIK